jgi:hypothetical protein
MKHAWMKQGKSPYHTDIPYKGVKVHIGPMNMFIILITAASKIPSYWGMVDDPKTIVEVIIIIEPFDPTILDFLNHLTAGITHKLS